MEGKYGNLHEAVHLICKEKLKIARDGQRAFGNHEYMVSMLYLGSMIIHIISGGGSKVKIGALSYNL